MYCSALPLRRQATKTYYRHEGAFFPETMTFWGTYTDQNYGLNRQGKPVGLTDNLFIRRYWQGGLELLALMLDNHDYSGDAKVREALLPLARDIISFFDHHWPRDDQGKIRFDPAQSLETYWDVVNPLPEIAGLRYVLPRLLTLPAEESLKRQWRHLLNDLPPIPSRTMDGKSFLLPAAQFSNTQNCENPELYAVFPYQLYTVSGPSEMQEIGRETWLRRLNSGTGGWQQNAIQAAMLGLDDEAKAAVVANARSNSTGFRFPAMWGPNFEQCEGDRMLLLPAWPQTWDAEFKLHAPYQTTVEGVIRDGKLIEYKVTPESRKNNLTVFERPKVSP
jgi:hypothetical protein